MWVKKTGTKACPRCRRALTLQWNADDRQGVGCRNQAGGSWKSSVGTKALHCVSGRRRRRKKAQVVRKKKNEDKRMRLSSPAR